MDCEYESVCQNSNRCFKCVDQNMLKIPSNPWQKKQKTNKNLSKIDNTKERNAKDSWKNLEQEVADSLNNIPTIQEARRSRASGAMWFETGDIVDEILHPECKERTGRQLKSGDQSISIQKRWLEKAAEECKDSDKVMCLPFRFKGDEKIYTIFEHQDIAELITTMKAYKHDNEFKKQQIEVLQQQLQNQFNKEDNK